MRRAVPAGAADGARNDTEQRYASGVHSSRKIERASYDSVAFRYVAANTHPDHDTLATFRRRFLKQAEELFLQVLVLARELQLLKLGHIALDGTKVDANASKHRALSWAHANKIEAQLRREVQTLLARAEKSDRAATPHGMDVPAEIARREVRLSAIAQAKAQIEQRAAERFEAEQQAFEAKQAKRRAKRRAQRQAVHAGGQGPVPTTQADRGAGVWHHQAGDGLAADGQARAAQGPRRVAPGGDGLEHQAHACAAHRLNGATTRPLRCADPVENVHPA